MPFKNAPKKGTDRARVVMFTYLKELKGGKTFTAYVAGPTCWLHCHPSERTQPCLTELTGGELTCLHCAEGKVSEVKGVMPLYVEPSRKPFFVWLNEELRDVVDALTLHTKVTVGRDLGKGMPAWVVKCTNQEPAFTTTLPERQRPADIAPTLLKIFRMPELVHWYTRTGGGTYNTTPKPTEGKPVEKWDRFVSLGSRGGLSGSVVQSDTTAVDTDARSEQEREQLRALQARDTIPMNGHHKKCPRKEE